jgi:hypothetical protein
MTGLHGLALQVSRPLSPPGNLILVLTRPTCRLCQAVGTVREEERARTAAMQDRGYHKTDPLVADASEQTYNLVAPPYKQ